MVASTSTTAQRFVSPPSPVLSGRWQLLRFNRADADILFRSGIIPEDASSELLDGMIVLKDRAACDEDVTMVGKRHRACVERLSNLRSRINAASRHVESQQPLVCSDTHVPEPDFMVIRGTLESYADFPTAQDVFCVVEVADSSYERDAGPKLSGYARAGIPQYVIINLRQNTAEVYSDPDPGRGAYPPPRIVAGDGVLSLRVGEVATFDVRLSEIVP